ncbi:MAG: hypothetical protein BRC58_04595 [Cyanobacteria bacterium QS_8_64_29]|nr:MAG: hypothetical protein BRC58_04595 [Cyanobacteria bacterium QS_8_64_29]
MAVPVALAPLRAAAHGTVVEYRRTEAIAIQARYEGGDPMANAQVTVYAPDEPSNPWRQGTTDSKGRFAFVPPGSASGNWEVRVRKAGHGEIANIPLGQKTGSAAASGLAGSTGYTPLQKALMGAVGVWGFVGTALFFAQRRS